jgi:predicted ester cyclase
VKGFDPKWKDFPDYILGITREIWEERGIHTLYRYYAEDIIVRSPGSVVVGNKGVIAATMATLAEFPDRQLLGEDVIWCGTPEEGMLSSHRILSTATHSGNGVYGSPTGTRLMYRVIADCHAIGNKINDEWLVRDQGAIVRQMGWDPQQYARDLVAREGGPDNCVRPLTRATDKMGPYTKSGNGNAFGAKYEDIVLRIMNAEMSAVSTEYDRACHLEHPGGQTVHGREAADRFWMGLRASFPSAEFRVEHRIGNDDEAMPPRAALRWSLSGKHDGWGMFGKPTGAEVYILGISHAEFGPWGLRREYVLFDETAIWKQIVMQTG